MKCPNCSFEGTHKELYNHLLQRSDKEDIALMLTDALAKIEGLKVMLRRYGVFVSDMKLV